MNHLADSDLHEWFNSQSSLKFDYLNHNHSNDGLYSNYHNTAVLYFIQFDYTSTYVPIGQISKDN